ncbi:MAG: methyltransferase [Mariniphaga sp.]|nr:methyltransferase [Mariniphaga sp.]
MRIIGGAFKSRIFRPGKNFKARPTTDFARENLFNILDNRYTFEDKRVLDLFSGTGSISFEFASRGCQNITCVEMDRFHYNFICSVIEKLDIKDAVKAVNGDVFKFIGRSIEQYNIIFADPPYELKRLAEIPDLILNGNLLPNEGLLILEHGKTNDFSSHPCFSELRTYGSVHFSFFTQKK